MPDSPDKKPVSTTKPKTAKSAAPAAPAAKSVAAAKPVTAKASAKTPAAAAPAPKVSAPAATGKVSAPASPAKVPAPAAKPVLKAAPVVTEAVPPKPVAAKPVPVQPAAAPVVAKVPEPPAPTKPEPMPALDVEAKPAASPVVEPIEAAQPEAAPAPEPAPDVATASQKGILSMNETVLKAEETSQKMFGDMKERATAAYAKSSKLAEESVEYHKANLEALVESTKLAAKNAETMGQDAAEFGRKSFESATAALKGFASAKTPTELFKLQSDYAKSSFDSLVAEASKASETWLKVTNEIFQPISSRISVTVEKMKTSAL